jgi:hypothetical protein
MASFKATLNAAHHGAQALKSHITNLFQACALPHAISIPCLI